MRKPHLVAVRESSKCGQGRPAPPSGTAPRNLSRLPVGPRRLPEAGFPQRLPRDGDVDYTAFNRRRAVRTWLLPYFRSLLHAGELRPLLAYLFTEYRCNLQCHYCWASDNRVQGMSEKTARESVEWLHSLGCRVLALMGGEPLLRPDFVHRLTAFAVRNGFFVYLPTNGRLLSPEVIDRLGAAGLATVNLAVDVVNPKPGLPKAFSEIRPQFDCLVRRQRRYGYSIFLNINICRNNIDDALQLTEIGRENDVATDYHINEEPLIEQQHFRHYDDNATYIREQDWPRVDELLDRLIEKNRSGYKMVNTVKHFQDMKLFLRGVVEPWECRAGRNSLIIRIDGTLAPCFAYYAAGNDWGTVGAPSFDQQALTKAKKRCTLRCLSTCQHTLGYSYNAVRVLKWLAKQAKNGFRGVTGGF